MQRLKIDFRKLKFTALVLVLLAVGCSGVETPAVTAGGISIARRGESLLTPEGASLEAPGAAISSVVENTQLPSETPLVETSTPEFTATPDFTATPEEIVPTSTLPAPTITPTAPEMKTPEASTETAQEDNAAGGDCLVDENRAFEAVVIELLNGYREENGVRTFSEQSQLTQAARLHSEDMACSHFFSHISPTAGELTTRVEAQGYTYSAVGENIAAGYPTAEEVVSGWMASSAHKANILNPQFTQAGVGFVYSADSQYGSYWTIIFGSP